MKFVGPTLTTTNATFDATGLTMTSGATVVTLASTTTGAGLRLPHGTAPTTPVDGDVWTTTLGMYVRVNGATVGPLGTGSGGGSTSTPGWNVTATGTGASQNITLPETVAATDIFVFCRGVFQRPTTDYTVSGTTLTFTSYASGDSITIIKPTAAGANIVQGFTIGVSGKPASSQRFLVTAPYSFTIGAVNSKGTALVAATASTVFTIKKGTVASPTTIGTFTFAAGATTATVSISAGSVVSGDVLWIEAPATADTTLADITFLVRA